MSRVRSGGNFTHAHPAVSTKLKNVLSPLVSILRKRENRLFSSLEEEDPAAAYLHIFFGHFSFFFLGGKLVFLVALARGRGETRTQDFRDRTGITVVVLSYNR